MSLVVFYEKPGCLTNARQKALLQDLGHCLEVRDLLVEPWTAERLQGFFGDLPVASWFNPSAPLVRDGGLDPATLDADSALALLVADPLLIRRPLIQVGELKGCGFEPGPVLDALGVNLVPGEDLQACTRLASGAAIPQCPSPEG